MTTHISLRPEILTFRNFVKRLGYKSAQNREFNVLRKMLEKQGIIEIQQSGYAGHSLAHPKLVVIHKFVELENIERINANLRVNFAVGPFTVHRATKPFNCRACSEEIWPGERYGSRVKLGRRTAWGRQILKYTILCLPCLIVRYDDLFV